MLQESGSDQILGVLLRYSNQYKVENKKYPSKNQDIAETIYSIKFCQ